MNRRAASLVCWACTAVLAIAPLAAIYYLIDADAFAQLVKTSLAIPIQWQTVANAQWYIMWGLMAAYVSIGLAGLFFLRRAFANFARGEMFNLTNSKNLKRGSLLLCVQAFITPLYFAASSLVLSINHPAGEKILSLSFGSNELKIIGIGLVLWVMSSLLVEGSKLQSENRQFV
ncbi:MAG: DUF2975 domain-containing protein [Pseudomonadaceae bacterium]|nr:DUF2975 domain-containing protein [Pseudomonadaceae bacterium]